MLSCYWYYYCPVYTNVTGSRYPQEPHAIQKILKEQLLNQVLFQQEIENIYAAGGYYFVEFGPKNVLTNLVKEILNDKPHIAIAVNPSHTKNSDKTLRQAIVQLQVAGLYLQNLDHHVISTHVYVLIGCKFGMTNYERWGVLKWDE